MNYQDQAINFCKKYNVTFKVSEGTFKKHFYTDKEPRWVFKITLKRNEKSYTFNFGQSIAAGNIKPTEYNVLTCLVKYDPETFENFCSEYGYDNDSISALKTYKAVCKEWKGVDRLFSDIIDELREIQ